MTSGATTVDKMRLSYLLSWACFVVGLHSGQSVASSLADAEVTTVTSTCGQNVEIRAVSPDSLKGVGVILDDELYAGVTCSWVVLPASNRSSNVFLFKRPDNCEVNQLEFFDLDPVTGNTSFIGQWCLEHANSFAGRPGFPTVIRYVTHNVTETNVTLFVQGSYVMPEEQCPPTLLNLTAGYNETRLSVRGFLDRLPNGMKCSWIFRTPGKGVLHLKLFSFPWHITGSRYRPCGTDDFFYVMDIGHPQMSDRLRVDLCEQGTSFTHRSISGETMLSFQTGDTGGAPDFTITYWAEDIDGLCPTTATLLEASEGIVGVFKGVNHAMGSAAERDCSWSITTGDVDKVVKLVNMSSFDYLADCGSGDTLKVEGYPRPFGMCPDGIFPVWSKDWTTDIAFHADPGTPRREFLIYYTAVRKGKCQGHPVSLRATGRSQTVAESALLDNTSDGTDCRWRIEADHQDTKVQVTVPIPSRDPTNAAQCCCMPGLSVVEGPDEWLEDVACSSSNTSLVFTSRFSSLLVIFKKDPDVSGPSARDFEMSFVAIGDHTGSAIAAALPSFRLLAMLLLLCRLVSR